MFDPQAMGAEVVKTVRDFCARAIEPLTAGFAEVTQRVAAVEDQVKALPAPSIDAEAITAQIADQVRAAVAALPEPQNGVDGKNIDPAEVERMVQLAVDALPKAQDGKSVDTAELAQLVARSVAEIAQSLPKPATSDELLAVVEPAVERAVKALPIPQDGEKGESGKDADADAITADVLDRVTKALEQIPAPQNGKDADPAVIAQAVKEEVARAVADLPKPADGKSIDPAELAAEIAKAAGAIVQALPVPQDGKSVSVEELVPAIDAAVERAVGKIELPQPVTLKDVAEMVGVEIGRLVSPMFDAALDKADVEEIVRAAIANAPVKGDPGKDADPETIRLMVAEILPSMVERAQAVLAERMEKAIDEMPTSEALVAAVVKEIPTPRDGVSADIDQVRKMVADAVNALPVPKDGNDADPVTVTEMAMKAAAAQQAEQLDRFASALISRFTVAEHAG